MSETEPQQEITAEQESKPLLTLMRWVWALPSALFPAIATYYCHLAIQSLISSSPMFISQILGYLVSGWAFTIVAVTCVPGSKSLVAILALYFLFGGILVVRIINLDYIYSIWISLFTILGSALQAGAYRKGKGLWSVWQ